MTLFDSPDIPLRHYRQATYVVGDFFEELASVVFKADRMGIDSRCICPDLRRGNLLIESKAMKVGGHTLHYLHRIDKYETFITESEYQLVYAFWVHKTKSRGYDTIREYTDALAENVDTLYIFNPVLVHSLRRLRKIEDYSKLGYRLFFRMRHTDLKNWGEGVEPKTFAGAEVYGRKVSPFKVISDVGGLLLRGERNAS